MDDENNGTPYEQMDDLGGNTPIFGEHPYHGKSDRWSPYSRTALLSLV